MEPTFKEFPNIIYILADDMGYGDAGCNNPESKIPTPNLDRLAAEGMRFTDAHAPTSVCTPSRYAILTGRYCWRSRLKNGVLWPWDPALIEPGRLTIGKLLQQHGYRTACIGKWHLGWNWKTKDGRPAHEGTEIGVFDKLKRYELSKNIDFTKPMSGGPTDCGFNYYYGDDVPNFPPYTWIENDCVLLQPTEEMVEGMEVSPGPMSPGWRLDAVMPRLTERAVQFIEEASDTPFFLYFSLTSPHTPIVPLEAFKGMSGAGDYGDFVCETDWAVGQVMQALERKGISSNTLIIFTSDNGPERFAYQRIEEYGHYSMGDLRGVKRDAWEGGHRVPFIARWPLQITQKSVSHDAVCLSDLMATAADIIGAELPDETAEDSSSMLSILLNRKERSQREAIVHHSMRGKFAIRKEEWVLIDAPSGEDSSEPDWFKRDRGYVTHELACELYNLKEDPSESHNVFGLFPEKASELKQLLDLYKSEGRSVWRKAQLDKSL